MFKPQVYIERRKKLKEKLKSGIILFLGNGETPYNYPANPHSRFRQDSSFLYFFGLDYSDLVAVVDIDNDKEYIFANDAGMEDIVWTGPQETVKEKALKVGIENTAPLAKLKDFVNLRKDKIHFLPQYRAENKIFLSELLNLPIKECNKNASLELIKAVVSLRSYKQPCEIEELEKAQSIAYKLHSYIAGAAKPGSYEYEIAGGIEGIIYQNGGFLGFPIICSVHGETLHNLCNKNKLKNGDLLLTDTGPETDTHYIADITRTYPVGGKFTTRQREIYEIVLKANTETIKICKPQVSYCDLHINAWKIIAEGLKQLGLMKGNAKEAAKKGAVALFMPHGLGHMLGLDAHDMEALGEHYVGYDNKTKRSKIFGLASLRFARKLQENFVLTVEPGIYFIPELIERWKNQNKFSEFINYDKLENYKSFGGIRIEDNILVTKTGCRVLGSPIPKTVSEIENAVVKNIPA